MGYNWERLKMLITHLKTGLDIKEDKTINRKKHWTRGTADITLLLLTKIVQGAIIGATGLVIGNTILEATGLIERVIYLVALIGYTYFSKWILEWNTEINWEKWDNTTKKGETKNAI